MRNSNPPSLCSLLSGWRKKQSFCEAGEVDRFQMHVEFPRFLFASFDENGFWRKEARLIS